MPTITIRNGNRTLKLTKRETDALDAARFICIDIARDFEPMKEAAEDARGGLAELLSAYLEFANGKPAAKQPE